MQQSTDFEVHPIGTGAELARLHDQARELAEALGEILAELDDREPPQGSIYRDTGGMIYARTVLAKAGY
jgi:hypothetical protein